MSYKNIRHVLPDELVVLIQDYIDGAYIYIPRKEVNKRPWGSNSTVRIELAKRNRNIYQDYLKGIQTDVLAVKYYLSLKSIQRIILREKQQNL